MRRLEGGHGGRSWRRLAPALLGLLAATTLAATACGGDDDNAAAVASTTAGPAPAAAATTGAAAAGDTAAFCDAYMDVNMAGAALGDPDADPVAFAGALIEPAKKAASLAPPELAAELSAAVAKL